MIIITEATIEQALDWSELESSPESLIEAVGENQAAVLAYIFSENASILTQEEKEYLLYLTLIIWKAVQLAGITLRTVTQEEIGKADEQNWELMEQQAKVGSFRDKLDLFFEKSPQEDLLAFIEDGLSMDEDGIVTKEGRELLFVILKTISDCWVAQGN